MSDAFYYMIGAIIAGVIVGLVPAILGSIKEKPALAIGGFFACVVAAILLGLILAIPVCCLFVYLILKTSKKLPPQNYYNQNPQMPNQYPHYNDPRNTYHNPYQQQAPNYYQNRFCNHCGNQLQANDRFCNRCGKGQ